MSLAATKVLYLKKYLKYNDLIPSNFLQQCLKIHPEWNPNRVNNVRYGKTVDLKMLTEIVDITVLSKKAKK